MQITLSGQLLHVCDMSTQRDTNRFGIQVLKQPTKGDPMSKAELHTYKLPRDTNPNRYNNAIGNDISVHMSIWQKDGQQGFFIREESDITIKAPVVKEVVNK